MNIILIFLSIVFVILCIGVITFLIFNSLGFFAGAPYATTPQKIVDEIFALVDVSERDTIYDLGSGDGRILIAAAKRGAKAVGWEINLPLYLWSVRRIRRLKLVHQIRVHFGNFWKKDLSGATIIFAFLLPEYMARLEKKVSREVAAGVKVITYLAKLPTRKPVQTTDDGIAIYQF